MNFILYIYIFSLFKPNLGPDLISFDYSVSLRTTQLLPPILPKHKHQIFNQNLVNLKAFNWRMTYNFKSVNLRCLRFSIW